LPGRNPHQAREAFLGPLRRALSCITADQLYIPDKNAGEVEALTLSRDPLPLHSPHIGIVQFVLGHQFRLVQDPDSWHVSTVAYRYHLLNEAGRELIAWHWHPGTGNGRPHIHMQADPIERRVHIPTGRVSIEAVLRMLLADLQVAARRDDFAQVLDETEEKFIQHRRWHSSHVHTDPG
jgi:hypothetical protein